MRGEVQKMIVALFSWLWDNMNRNKSDPVISMASKKKKKKNVYMCITESLCCIAETT